MFAIEVMVKFPRFTPSQLHVWYFPPLPLSSALSCWNPLAPKEICEDVPARIYFKTRKVIIIYWALVLHTRPIVGGQ